MLFDSLLSIVFYSDFTITLRTLSCEIIYFDNQFFVIFKFHPIVLKMDEIAFFFLAGSSDIFFIFTYLNVLKFITYYANFYLQPLSSIRRQNCAYLHARGREGIPGSLRTITPDVI